MAFSLKEAVRRIREKKAVPIGIISYNVEEDRIDILLFTDVDKDEANAILSKLHLTVLIKEE